MKTKICNKCKQEKPIVNFWKDKKAKDGLFSSCKQCGKILHQQYNKENPEKVRAWVNRYQSTIKGYLNLLFNHIKDRCENPKHPSYKDYGGRGIQNKFRSLNDFRNYVINILQIDPRGLQIDRINNDGHYKPGNIQFITRSENLKNRRSWKK